MANESNLDAALTSMEFYSAHVESLRTALDPLNVNDEKAKMNMEIELSKVHWSELSSSYYKTMKGPGIESSSTSLFKWINEEGIPEWKAEVAQDNERTFRSLQEKYPSGFFIDENDLGPNSTQRLPKWMLNDDGTCWFQELCLSSETPFAQGGQANLFHAHIISTNSGKRTESLVMKVFKEGMPLRDLKLFPITILDDETCIEGQFGESLNNCNFIGSARLLKSYGRFAFLMERAWRDLRSSLIEECYISTPRTYHFQIM